MKKNSQPKAGVRSLITEWAGTLVIMLFASTSLAWSYVVPTGSMEDTIMVGDHMLVDKLVFAPQGSLSKHLLPYRDPKHGDIIAFIYPADPSQTYVKRLIGLPGDRLKMVDQKVYRNGKLLNEPYIFHKSGYPSQSRDNFPSDPASIDVAPQAKRDVLLRDMLANHVRDGEIVVPPDNYFAMGDNRDNSLDSRYWGFVPRENVVGTPIFVFWSYDAPTDELMPQTAGDFARHMLDMGQHFITRTRWSRTLKPIRSYADTQD
jgi:signal peptidase I